MEGGVGEKASGHRLSVLDHRSEFGRQMGYHLGFDIRCEKIRAGMHKTTIEAHHVGLLEKVTAHSKMLAVTAVVQVITVIVPRSDLQECLQLVIETMELAACHRA